MRISAFISNRNHGRYLYQAVESITKNQKVQPYEIILIDDASDDNSRSEMLKCRRLHDRVTIVLHEARIGHIEAYNEGISLCMGEALHLMSADDVMKSPHFYEEATHALRDGAAFFSCGLQWMDASGMLQDKKAGAPFQGMVNSEEVIEKMREFGNFVNGAGTVVLKEIQKQFPYDPALPMSADWANWIKILHNSRQVAFTQQPMFLYRRHDAQMTSTKSASEEERAVCRSLLSA